MADAARRRLTADRPGSPFLEAAHLAISLLSASRFSLWIRTPVTIASRWVRKSRQAPALVE
jgi:hypothetical protein